MPDPSGRTVRRGEVYKINPSQQGGVLYKERPVVVVQNDVANERACDTIVVAIREDRRRSLPVLVPVERGVGGLSKDSSIDTGHIVTVRKEWLAARIGTMPAEVMRQVDQALRTSLAL